MKGVRNEEMGTLQRKKRWGDNGAGIREKEKMEDAESE